MIQRIQSLFLLCVLFACIACFSLPFWTYTGQDYNYTYLVSLFAVELTEGNAQNLFVSTMPIIVIISVSAILSIVSIFYYKNRLIQIKINNYNLFLTIIFIGAIYLWIPYMIEEKLPNAIRNWNYGLILPLFSLIFLILANRFIKKDEKLVRSTDRLR